MSSHEKSTAIGLSKDEAVASSSKTTGLDPFLAVPREQIRRGSVESALSGSDISEFSMTSLQGHELFRTVSHTSVLSPATWRTWFSEFWVANYGAFLVLISQLFGAVMSITTRLLETPGPHGEPMHPFQILFARQSITVLITVIYAMMSKSVPDFPFGPPGRVRLLLVSRGVFGFLGVFGFYFSLQYLPISEAIVLTFIAPIGTCIAFAMLLPGETFSRRQQLAGFISLIGVLFIARPGMSSEADNANGAEPDLSQPSTAQHLQAVGLSMLGVIGAIGAMTSIRAIGDRAHALLSVNYFSALCTIVSLVALLIMPSVQFRFPGNMLEWVLLTSLGLAGFIMQLLLTQGMAYGASPSNQQSATDLESQGNENRKSKTQPVSREIKGSGAKATSMMYTQMLFALLSDKVVFGITPVILSWVGSGFILFGAIWVAADKSEAPISADKGTGPIEMDEHNMQTKSSSAALRAEEQVGLLASEDNQQSAPDGTGLTLNAIK